MIRPKRTARIDEATKTEMRYWRYRGMSNKRIQAEFGIYCSKTVQRICGPGIQTEIKITDKEKRKIQHDYSHGKPLAEISKKYGYSASVITRVCEKIERKVKLEKPESPFKSRNEEILRRRHEGETFVEIAESLHISTARAREIFLKLEKKSGE